MSTSPSRRWHRRGLPDVVWSPSAAARSKVICKALWRACAARKIPTSPSSCCCTSPSTTPFPVLSPACQDLIIYGNPFKQFAEAEEELASLKPSTLPPSSYIAASKLSLVLVEGSKKSVASFFLLHFSQYLSGLSIISFAVAISSFTSSTVKSRISIKLLIYY